MEGFLMQKYLQYYQQKWHATSYSITVIGMVKVESVVIGGDCSKVRCTKRGKLVNARD